MKKNVDELLNNFSADEPPRAFDERMDRLFAAYPERGGLFARPVPAWSLVAVCVLSIGLGFYLRGPVSSPATGPAGQSTVYIFQLPDNEAGRAFASGAGKAATLRLNDLFQEGVEPRVWKDETPTEKAGAPAPVT